MRPAHSAATPASSALLTLKEAADRLKCSRSRIYTMVGAGDLPAYKEGGRTVFRAADLDAYLSNLRPAKIGAAGRGAAR